MERAAPLVSVIVVVWNVRELALRCLETLHARSGGVPLEVILVDNGSTDGTVEAVRARFPDTVVIANPANLGFPKSNNQALRRATGTYVLFLNSDAFVGDGVLPACVAELEREAEIGMVGCRLTYEGGRPQYECARRDYRLSDLLSEVLYLHMLLPHHRLFARHLMGEWDHLGRRDVEAISGAFMLARREAAQAVGGLPEDILMYHEDLSFCLRMRRAGWRIRFLGDVSSIHVANQTTAKNRLRWYLLEGECKLRLIREAQGPVAAAVGRGVFALRSLLRVGVAGVGAVLPGLGRAKRRYPKVFHLERHALQLLWSVAPWAVRRLVPAPPTGTAAPRVLERSAA